MSGNGEKDEKKDHKKGIFDKLMDAIAPEVPDNDGKQTDTLPKPPDKPADNGVPLTSIVTDVATSQTSAFDEKKYNDLLTQIGQGSAYFKFKELEADFVPMFDGDVAKASKAALQALKKTTGQGEAEILASISQMTKGLDQAIVEFTAKKSEHEKKISDLAGGISAKEKEIIVLEDQKKGIDEKIATVRESIGSVQITIEKEKAKIATGEATFNAVAEKIKAELASAATSLKKG